VQLKIKAQIKYILTDDVPRRYCMREKKVFL